jgi:xylulokinase
MSSEQGARSKVKKSLFLLLCSLLFAICSLYYCNMLLTIDIGTSTFKSAIWDFEGNRLAFETVPLSISRNEGLRHETDSGQWLRAFEDCCRAFGTRALGANINLNAVEAIIICGNGPSLTPVLAAPSKEAASSIEDGQNGGLGLHTALSRLWLDRRAAEAARQVSALMGDFVDPSFFLPKALDIKINEPALYENTKFFLGCPELLAYALTGEAWTVFPSDGFERWFWNDSILESLGLDKEKFPPFIRPGEVFGKLIPRAAARFGFKPGLRVISGGPDFFAAILGTGTIRPGQACDRAGTSEGINACTKRRVSDKRLMSYNHPVKPFWNLSGVVSTTGKAIEWGRDLLGIKSYDEFYALAQTARPGAGGLVFLPYLAGERAPVWDPSKRGVIRGLGLDTGRPEFARSVLEGICFAIRDITGIMEESASSRENGVVIDELRVAGSLSGSDLLNQIKADITKKPVFVPVQKEAVLMGLAVIGAYVLTQYASFAEAASALVKIDKEFLPDAKNAALYDELFGEYIQIAKSN